MATTSDRDRKPPSLGKLLREGPALARLILSQFRRPPAWARDGGDRRPVVVIPGFLANDASTSLLRRTLEAAGFRAFGWGYGMNLGARADTLDRLAARLDAVIAEAGKPVSLVGWSLGGLYARELARHRPGDVDLVVTLGTPFAVDLHANNAWRVYELINDHKVDNPPIPIELDHKPPVRTVALWSRRDGIVAPASARGTARGADETIEVDCRHMEFVSDPRALRAVIEVLTR